MKTNSPCKDCTERCVGCHSRCVKYKEWQAIHETERREENKARANSAIFTDIDRLRMARVAKAKKKRGH